MIKRFTVAFCLVIIFLSAKAQQDPYYSHFMLNKLAYNPGVAGYKNAICANVLAHRQWVGYQDGSLEYKDPGSGQSLQRRAVGPQTYFGTVTMPMPKLKGGIGLVFMSDAVGYERTINVKLGYAYKKEFNQGNQLLQFGLDAGLLQKEFDGSYYNPRQPNDPLIPTGTTSGRKFDLGLGAFYNNYKLNNLEIGVSATHVTGGTVSYSVGSATQKVSIVPNIYITASQSYPIGRMVLQPNIWVKTVFSTTQFDLNCRAVIDQLYVAGLSYRDGGKSKYLDAFSLQLGYYVQPEFYIGYAYDVPLTKGLAGGGTHEIVATYCFKLSKTPPPVRYRIDQRHLGGYR